MKPVSGEAFATPAEDEIYMRRALEWAERGLGWNSPRPSVGCVIVRDGEVLGGGHTQPGDGQPHAEVMALRAAVLADPEHGAGGATAYVTLEPCSHWGTTPPCSEALIRAGIARCVSGVQDPNPLVSGRGLQKLREAGIEVRTGVLEAQCRRTHEAFLKSIVQRSPFVTLKAGVSLDGQIAQADGSSKWITGAESRARAHRLRQTHDAILVGIGTVLADDPALDVRLPAESGLPVRQPVKIVLDTHGRTPLNARLWQGGAKVIVVTGEEIAAGTRQELEGQGGDVLALATRNGGVDWHALLPALFQRNLHSVLVEGGARVAGSALAAGVVDKVCYFVAPILMGEGLGAVSGYAPATLAQAPRLSEVWHESLGEDVLISGYLQGYSPKLAK